MFGIKKTQPHLPGNESRPDRSGQKTRTLSSDHPSSGSPLEAKVAICLITLLGGLVTGADSLREGQKFLLVLRGGTVPRRRIDAPTNQGKAVPIKRKMTLSDCGKKGNETMQGKAADSLKSPRFCGIKTFMRMEYGRDLDSADFVVVEFHLTQEPPTAWEQGLGRRESGICHAWRQNHTIRCSMLAFLMNAEGLITETWKIYRDTWMIHSV